MNISRELEREFNTISETKFWQLFQERIIGDRQLLVKDLKMGESIGRPCVRGEIWQAELRVIDNILKLPAKIIGYKDVAEEGE